MLHSRPSHCLVFLGLLLLAASATRAERFIYSFSGHVRSIHDPSGLLTSSNYYRTGDIVSARFVIDPWAAAFVITGDHGLILIDSYYRLDQTPFYSRLISGPLMPNLLGQRASRSSGHLLYGIHYHTNYGDVGSSTLFGGNSLSQFRVVGNGHDGWIGSWREGLEVTGIATAAADAIAPTAVMDMRLDSITPAFNNHSPKPVISIPQAINIPGLIESTNNTFSVLSGRTRPMKVRLHASPPVDGDGDPAHFSWWRNGYTIYPGLFPFMSSANGEKPIMSFTPGTHYLDLLAFDGSSFVDDGLSLTIYTPSHATEILRAGVRTLPGSTPAETALVFVLQKAKASFSRQDWKRGVQFLQISEQFMARSALTIPASKRTSLIALSRAIRRAVAQPR